MTSAVAKSPTLESITTSVAAPVATGEDPYAHLIKRLYAQKDNLLVAMGDQSFYMELLFILLALLLAWLLARFIQKRVRNYLQKNPTTHIDAEVITKPLLLLTPLLAWSFLNFAQLISESFAASTAWIQAFIQLSLAYFLAKCVTLVIRSRLVSYTIATAIIITALLKAMRFSKSTAAWLSSIAFDVGHYHISMLHLLNGLVILVFVFWLASVSSRALESYLRRSSTLSYNGRELTVKGFKIFVYFIALVITMSAIGIDLTAFAIFGGALGVGLGLGLQKLSSNMFSSITLLMEKSIKIGDLIEVGGYTGWVRQLNMRYALIETFDGREIIIPNEELVSTRIINWTHTTNRACVDIKVTIDFDSDAVAAQALMLEAAHEHPLCLDDPAPSCWLREFAGNGLNFVLTFWIADIKQGRVRPQSDVMFSILEKFRKAGIKLARTI